MTEPMVNRGEDVQLGKEVGRKKTQESRWGREGVGGRGSQCGAGGGPFLWSPCRTSTCINLFQ